MDRAGAAGGCRTPSPPGCGSRCVSSTPARSPGSTCPSSPSSAPVTSTRSSATSARNCSMRRQRPTRDWPAGREGGRRRGATGRRRAAGQAPGRRAGQHVGAGVAVPARRRSVATGVGRRPGAAAGRRRRRLRHAVDHDPSQNTTGRRSPRHWVYATPGVPACAAPPRSPSPMPPALRTDARPGGARAVNTERPRDRGLPGLDEQTCLDALMRIREMLPSELDSVGSLRVGAYEAQGLVRLGGRLRAGPTLAGRGGRRDHPGRGGGRRAARHRDAAAVGAGQRDRP